jgi:protein-S-isoprenylcysteine O-methyltransferase Ste14
MIAGPMKSKKTILIATVGGALLGAVIALYGAHVRSAFPALALDRALLSHRLFLTVGLPWILFSFYWEAAAKNAATTQSSESRGSRALHVLLANVALLVEIAPIRGLGRFLPVSTFVMAAGLAVQGLGLFLAIWSRRVLGRNWSGEISIKVEHELIRSGPYKGLRHPIYTGLLTMYVGTAVVAGEWLSIIGLAVAVYAYWRKIRLEEANLEAAFGADYAVYRRETWALLPGLF